MPDIKLGSLFDGIGVFPLAASRCGIRPVWASEIEKAPISITKRHFPDMVHLGDITKVDGGMATASGVSPLTVANIEKGKSVSLLLFISVLRSLGLLENLEQLVPEIRVSPIELKKLQGKKRYRVRHLKQDNHE